MAQQATALTSTPNRAPQRAGTQVEFRNVTKLSLIHI